MKKTRQITPGNYSFTLIEHDVHRIHSFIKYQKCFFHENNITPVELYYEDLITDIPGTVSRVLKEMLDIDVKPEDVPEPRLKKQANEVNDYMVKRYTEESKPRWRRPEFYF